MEPSTGQETSEDGRNAPADAERALLAEAVLDGVANPMFVKDAELRFVFVNEAFASMYGLRPADMVGRRGSDFSAADDAAAYEETERSVLQDGLTYEAEEDFEFRGIGRSRIVRKNLIRMQSGRRYVACQVFDISELKRREREAEEAHRRLAELVESMPAGIIIYDRDDRFVLANRTLKESLPGLEAAWVPGRTFREAVEIAHSIGYFRQSGDPELDALYESDPESWLCGYMARHQLQHAAYERQHKDGVWHRAYDIHTPDGSFIGVRVDITALKEREEELVEARQRAVLADRAKSEFLDNMSHEIRTPMNGVLGMAELLARSDLDPRQRTFTDIIVKSGNHLLTIISDILDFSKIHAGQLTLDPVAFDLADAVEDVATLMSARAREKDLQLVVRIDPACRTRYVGDVARVRQIITNLAGNAVKFTESGHVLIDVTAARIADGPGTVRIAVTDTGIGIAPEKLPSIFEKFSQADPSSTRRHEGTGLGLAIAARLVHLMGGVVGVDSEEGRGSTFWFTVDLALAGDGVHEKSAAASTSGSAGSRVVAVAGDRAEALGEMLASLDLDLCIARSAIEATEVIKAASGHGLAVDCVVVDGGDPDAALTVRAIRADPRAAGIPVLLMERTDQHTRSQIESAIVSAIRPSGVGGGLLPAGTAPEPDRSGTAYASPLGDHRGIDILVCEDNEVNQLVFTQILAETGYRFEVVDNGRHAVEAFRRGRPRLILMDVSMPELDGFDATRQIRALEAAGDGRVPIVGVTAHALRGDRERCMEAGMDDYLPKPVSPRTLLQKVDRWMGDVFGRKGATL